MSELQTAPNVLIIPDGNRRWARQNGADFNAAYEHAVERIYDIADHLGELGASDVWFPITRPFNMLRDSEELDSVHWATTRLYEMGQDRKAPVNVAIDGSTAEIPTKHLDKLKWQEAAKYAGRITAHLIFNWSAETEITDLVKRAQNNPDMPSDFEDLRAQSVVDQEIDLIIRTGLLHANNSGRLSNFMPWHSTAANLIFPSVLFPDFTTEYLDAALAEHAQVEHKNQINVA